MSLRELLFWSLDFIRGGKVRRAYNDISQIVDKGNTSKIEKRLNKLLDMASNDTIYYSKYKGLSLEKFPVVNKTIIRDNIQYFLSDKYKKENLHKVTTSGSTGTPFTVYQDNNKRIRHSADNVYFMKLSGYYVGCRLYYMRVWNSLVKHGFLQRLATNVEQIEISNLSDKKIEEILASVKKDRSKKTLLAFASTYDIIGRYISEKKFDGNEAKVLSIVSMSEHLPENSRQLLSQAFGAPVVSRYSNMENGFIGQQPIGEDYYVLNEASFKIELLSMSDDTPVEIGQIGRIVITDYYNYAMPFIRYDTGDLGIFESMKINGRLKNVLVSIEGRVVDMVFRTNGDIVSPHTITNTMWKYPYLIQWQFHQTGKRSYKFIINGDLSDSQRAILTQDIKNYLGFDAELSYEFVDDIPVLASGKRKKIVNSYV